MTPAEILRAAAVRITMGGWTQGAYGTCDGPVCGSGAIRAVAGGHPGADPGMAATIAMGALESFVGDTIPHWNDAPGRTAEEVIETLHKVADKLEGRT